MEFVEVLEGRLRVTLPPGRRGDTPQSEMTPAVIRQLIRELESGLATLYVQKRGQLTHEDVCPHCGQPATYWVIGGCDQPAVRCECKDGHSWVR